MKEGILVRFKQIAAGKHDDPPYSLDGQWRIGLLIEYNEGERVGTVLYRDRTYWILAQNMHKVEEDERT